MAKIIKRIEYRYAIDTEDCCFSLDIKRENMNDLELLGLLTLEREKLLYYLMDSDDIRLTDKERGIESEVKPDGESQP